MSEISQEWLTNFRRNNPGWDEALSKMWWDNRPILILEKCTTGHEGDE